MKHRLQVVSSTENVVRFQCRRCVSGISVGRDLLEGLLTGKIKQDREFGFIIWEDCAGA